MKTKNAVAMWCNLKGNYDIIIFNNKRNLNKFAKEYKTVYNELEQEKITFEEFELFANGLAEHFEEHIIKIENELYWRDIKEDVFTTYINSEQTKINIIEKLDYGF